MAMQVPTEEEILAGAIAGTEQEIFDEATGQAEDENNGDRSLEEMDDDIPGESEEGDDEPDEEEPDGETDETEEEIDAASEEDGEEPAPTQSEDRGRVPYSRFREEIENRRLAEQDAANVRAQLAAFQAQQQQRPQPQQEQPAKPDQWSDPEGYEAWLLAQAVQRVQNQQYAEREDYVNETFAEAHRERGAEFEAAYRTLTSGNPKDPSVSNFVKKIYMSPNPGQALMKWHDTQKTIREVGNDPDGFRARQRESLLKDPEFRKEAMQYWRGEAERGDGGHPRTSTRLPKSLNGASGGSSARNSADPELYNPSDSSAFAFAMK
jgi:hypothetical protein